MSDPLRNMSNDQLISFIQFQQSQATSQPSAKKRAAPKRAAMQNQNIMAEPLSPHYKMFFDLPVKVMRPCLYATTQCLGLNEINVGQLTLEQCFWILWSGFKIYTHTKIPKTLDTTVGHLVQEVKKCWVANSTSLRVGEASHLVLRLRVFVVLCFKFRFEEGGFQESATALVLSLLWIPFFRLFC